QFRGAVLQSNNIYLNTNEFKNIATPVQMRDDRFREQCMSQYPLHTYKRSAPILHELRAIKSDIEVALIR
ncbi:MAG TPA: aminopeptidase P family protein, partial [Candidatus Kapabacteria bacterium]|nr:aminopeptidase P family protein [Candidatus Kapabacteria bacterium]